MNKGFHALALCLAMAPAAAYADDEVRSPSAASGAISAYTASEAESSGTGLSASVGGSYATGDFGAATNTDIWSVPIGVRYSTGGWRLSAVIPWMSIRSDGTIFTGIDATPIVVAPGIKSTRRQRSGFGDLTLGAAYDIPSVTSAGLDLELSARIKVPTATDRSQLSTGKVDYAFGAQVSKQVGRFSPFVSATYRVFGDSGPWDLRNGMAASVGASYQLPGRATLIASYDYARAASRFVGDSHDLFGGVSVPIAHTPLRLTAFATAGLSRSAPDESGGLSVTASF